MREAEGGGDLPLRESGGVLEAKNFFDVVHGDSLNRHLFSSNSVKLEWMMRFAVELLQHSSLTFRWREQGFRKREQEFRKLPKIAHAENENLAHAVKILAHDGSALPHFWCSKSQVSSKSSTV